MHMTERFAERLRSVADRPNVVLRRAINEIYQFIDITSCYDATNLSSPFVDTDFN